jgi:nicotinamidase-related amidase
MTWSQMAIASASPRVGLCLAALMLATLLGAGAMNDDTTIIGQWSEVTPPDPPDIQKAVLDPGTTALLILDIEKRTTNVERRPRAVASVPRIASLLEKAREKGVFVAHSTTPRAAPEDILPAVRPARDEPVVQSSVDKFFRTDLEKHLSEEGIKTVIIVGTAAEGAVLHTATGACMRSMDVVVPVDGISSSVLYAEQYVCWHLLNAPGSRGRTTLTRTDLIEFLD